jgi:hypothetical protein
MRTCLTYLLFLFLLSLTFCPLVHGQYQLEYTIEIDSEGSAKWAIEHTFITGQDEELFAQLSDWKYFTNTFIKNVTALVNATKIKTGRMDMDVEKFVMTVNSLGSYKILKYEFKWIKFAVVEGNRIKIGDVFETDGLFMYGEGKVNIVYPEGYTVENVSPSPDDKSDLTLTWIGTKNFRSGEPRVELAQENSSSLAWDGTVFIVIGVAAIVVVGFVSFRYFKLRKKRTESIKPQMPSTALEVEDDEGRIVNLLKTAGGRLQQSVIVSQCRFSKAKTSLLLKSMEEKGIVRRLEKGREKIVILEEGDANAKNYKSES